MTLEQRVERLLDDMEALDPMIGRDSVRYDALIWAQELLAVVRLRYGDRSPMFEQTADEIGDFKCSMGGGVYPWTSMRGIARALRNDLATQTLDIQGQTEITKAGLFLAGETFDALYRIHGLVQAAAVSIELIDGYISADLLQIIKDKQTGVEVRLLTKDNSWSQGVKPLVSAFVTQYGSLEIRLSDDFHDRFLILDRKEYFHFGPSIKDAGKRACGFSPIEQPELVAKMQQMWDGGWQNGTPLV